MRKDPEYSGKSMNEPDHLGMKFKKVRYVFFVILPNLGTDTLKTLNEKKSTK